MTHNRQGTCRAAHIEVLDRKIVALQQKGGKKAIKAQVHRKSKRRWHCKLQAALELAHFLLYMAELRVTLTCFKG